MASKKSASIDQDAIMKHLANPVANPLPEGVRINFGDPEPIRAAEPDDVAEPEPAPNAADHEPSGDGA